MSKQLTVPAASPSLTPTCSCGSASCAEGGHLACLARPRFFCGQLLTDADLTALTDWVQGRLARTRRRAGWGVVEGLDVRVDDSKPNDANPSRIIVGPGYAVDSCGHDIVLCADSTPMDLTAYCSVARQPVGGPCAPAGGLPAAGNAKAAYARGAGAADEDGGGGATSVTCMPSILTLQIP